MTMCTACAHEESVRNKPASKKKVAKVMGEFKRGELKSSSGDTVTNPKQAVAVALSEARKKKS